MINLYIVLAPSIFFLCYFLIMKTVRLDRDYDSLLDFRWYDWLFGFVLSFLSTSFILWIFFLGTIAYVTINGCKDCEQKAQAFEQAFEQECFSKGGILNKALDPKHTTCTLKGE